jgi:hypothetical protein
MTRLERLIAAAAFFAAFVLLFLLASVVSGNLGPVEFLVVLALAIPGGLLIGRAARRVLRPPSRSA